MVKIKKIRSRLIKLLPKEEGVDYKIKYIESILCLRIDYMDWLSVGWIKLANDLEDWTDEEIKKAMKLDVGNVIKDLKEKHKELDPTPKVTVDKKSKKVTKNKDGNKKRAKSKTERAS